LPAPKITVLAAVGGHTVPSGAEPVRRRRCGGYHRGMVVSHRRAPPESEYGGGGV